MNFIRDVSKKNYSSLAISKYVKVSPLKVRRILKYLVSRRTEEAFFLLEFMPYRACRQISSVLTMAVANAKAKYGKLNNSFLISKAYVNEGTSMKRFQPHAQGRAFPIKKRLSHILIFSEIIHLIKVTLLNSSFDFSI